MSRSCWGCRMIPQTRISGTIPGRCRLSPRLSATTLAALRPAQAAYFHANAEKFVASLEPWNAAIAAFKAKYDKTPIAVTEPVADYLLQAMGFDILTPFSLQKAIMDGTDPSPQDVTIQNNLFAGHKVKVFAYNQQVTDTLTKSFLDASKKAGYPCGRRLRDDAHARLHLSVLDAGRGRRARESRHATRCPPRRCRRGTEHHVGRGEVLAVRQASVSLSGRSILKDIDFALEPGEFCGLIGANGSGKTTLLRTILGFVKAEQRQRHHRRWRQAGLGRLRAAEILPSIPTCRCARATSWRSASMATGWACRCPRGRAAARSMRCWKRWTRRGSPTSGSAACPAASSSGC